MRKGHIKLHVYILNDQKRRTIIHKEMSDFQGTFLAVQGRQPKESRRLRKK